MANCGLPFTRCQEDFPVLHAYRHANRGAVRSICAGASLDVERPPVKRTGDLSVLAKALGERAALVRATVVERIDLAVEEEEGEFEPSDAHTQGAVGRQFR